MMSKYESNALDHISGFKSLEDCMKAGAEAKKLSNVVTAQISFVCVKQ